MIYLDSSALTKLAVDEAESRALRAWLARQSAPMVSSALARTETARALMRVNPPALAVLPAVLALISQKPIDDEVLDTAGRFPEPGLRSLDAIHLATALSLRAGLSSFVAYDKRLAAIAADHGLPVVSPR